MKFPFMCSPSSRDDKDPVPATATTENGSPSKPNTGSSTRSPPPLAKASSKEDATYMRQRLDCVLNPYAFQFVDIAGVNDQETVVY